jgi:hypothetical protein
MQHVDDAHTRTQVAHTHRWWLAEARGCARGAPHRRFANLPPRQLTARLRQLAQANRFEVVRVSLLRPRQLAPDVVIRSNDKTRISRETAAILHQIDPKPSDL